MIIAAHGIEVRLPRGWSGRVFSPSGDVATLHAGNFPIVLGDGEFGDQSTGRMRAGGSFIALTEYQPGSGLEPGRGLFRARKIPLPLDPASFSHNGLAHPRPGQAGVQHFFTASGRPFCVYVVIAAVDRQRRHQLGALDYVLRSLRIARRV